MLSHTLTIILPNYYESEVLVVVNLHGPGAAGFKASERAVVVAFYAGQQLDKKKEYKKYFSSEVRTLSSVEYSVSNQSTSLLFWWYRLPAQS